MDYALADSWSSERLVVYEIFMTLQQNILGHNFVQESRNYLPNLRFLRKKIHKMRNCFKQYDIVVQNNIASVIVQ